MPYELSCKACGQHFQHADKEQLARNVEEHNRARHGEQKLDRAAFEERVRETTDMSAAPTGTQATGQSGTTPPRGSGGVTTP